MWMCFLGGCGWRIGTEWEQMMWAKIKRTNISVSSELCVCVWCQDGEPNQDYLQGLFL